MVVRTLQKCEWSVTMVFIMHQARTGSLPQMHALLNQAFS